MVRNAGIRGMACGNRSGVECWGIRGMACGNRSGVECWDKGNGVAGNMMSINNISILVVGVLGTTRMLMLVIFKRLGATGWSLCPRTKPGLWPTP